MAFNAGRWSGLLSQDSAAALAGSPPLAGTSSASQLGSGGIEGFQNSMNLYNQIMQGRTDEEKKMFGPQLMQNLFPSADNQLIQGVLKQNEWMTSKKGMEEMAEMFDKYQTRKGWKSAMFNTLSSGLENLTKGIGMSMNPYGTPEAARYAADMMASSGDRLAAAYAAARTPMNIPAVQVGAGPTYF